MLSEIIQISKYKFCIISYNAKIVIYRIWVRILFLTEYGEKVKWKDEEKAYFVIVLY